MVYYTNSGSYLKREGLHLSISDLKSKALSALKGNWMIAVGLTLIMFLINSVFVSGIEIILSGGFENWSNQETTPWTADIAGIAISIALIPLTVGVYWFYLSLLKGEKPSLTSAFLIYQDSRASFKMIIASILQGLFIFLWSLLLIIPGIIKSLSYSQTFYILKEHPELSAMEAIAESRKRMSGLKWKFFILNLSFIGWGILSIITLGIGFFWLIPYTSTTLAAFYDEYISV